MHSIDEMILRYGALAWEKQLFLQDLLGENPPNWAFNMDDGTLGFGDLYQFKIQLLGTESEATGTWLWAWANDASQIPADILKESLRLRDHEAVADISIFQHADAFSLNDQSSGHRLTMIASGLLGANAYYRGPYDGGALYMLIFDPNYPADTRKPTQRVAFAFPQFIQNVQVFDHKAAFQHYAEASGLTVESTEGEQNLIATGADGDSVRATFDVQKRMTQLTTILKKD